MPNNDTLTSTDLVSPKSVENDIHKDTLSTADIKESTITGNVKPISESGYSTINPDEYSKYIKGGVYPTSFLDEQRARNQGAGEQIRNGLVKMVGTAGTTFAETFTDLVAGIGYAVEKASGDPNAKFADVYNNAADKSFDKFNNYLEKAFPNYYTQQEQDASILGNMFGYGAGNWWGDKFIKNIGFTAGAIGAGIVTAGAGDWALGISRASKVASALIEGEKTLENANNLYKAGAITDDTLKAFHNSYKYVRAASKINATISSFASASTEAYIEGRNGLDDYIKGKTENYKSLYGTEPDVNTMAKFQEEGETLGNIRVALNMPLLMGSNMIQFGKLFARGFSKDALQLAEKNFIDKVTGKSLSELTATERLAAELTYVPIKYSGVLKALKSPLTEGFQEIEQYHIERTLQNYYDKKYDYRGREQVASFVDAMSKGFEEAYGTKAGLEQGFIGALTGAIGMPNIKGIQNRIKGQPGDTSIMAGGIWEGIGEAANEAAKGTAIADQLNDPKHIKRTIEQFDNFSSFYNNQKEYDKAIKEGDHFMAENSKYDDFSNHVIGQLESDSYDLYQAKVKALKGLTNDEFKKQFGYKELDPVKRVAIIDSMLTKAENIKKYWDMTNVRFNDINALGKIDQERVVDIRQMFVKSAGLIDDLTKRETDIGNKITKLTNGKLTYSDIQNIKGQYTSTDQLTNSFLNSIDDLAIRKESGNIINTAIKNARSQGITINKNDITEDIKKQAKGKVEDAILNRMSNTINNIISRENESGDFRKESQKRLKELRATQPQIADQVDSYLEDVSKIKDRRKQFVDFYNFLDKGIQSDNIQDLAKNISTVKEQVLTTNWNEANKKKAKDIEDAKLAKEQQDIETLTNATVEKETTIFQKGKDKIKDIIKPKEKEEIKTTSVINKINRQEPLTSSESFALQKNLVDSLQESLKIVTHNGREYTVIDGTKEEKKEDLDTLYGLLDKLDKYPKNNKDDNHRSARVTIESYIKEVEGRQTEDELDKTINESTSETTKTVEDDIKEWVDNLAPSIQDSDIEKHQKAVNDLFTIFKSLNDKIDVNNFTEFAKYLNNLVPSAFKEKYDKIRRIYNVVSGNDITLLYSDIIKQITPTVETKDDHIEESEERNKGIIRAVGKANKILAGIETEDDSDFQYEYNKSEVGHNLVAYLSRAYLQINDMFDKSKRRLDLNDKLLNNELALDPDYIKIGDTITLSIQSSQEFKPFEKDGKIFNYDDIARKEDGSLNIDSIPITIMKDGNQIGFLHTVNWINKDSIIGGDDYIKSEKDKLRDIRQYIVDNGIVTTKIEDKTNGYLIKQANKGISKVKDAFKNPNLKIAIVKDGSFKVTNTANFTQKYKQSTIVNENPKEGTALIEGATYLMLELNKDKYIAVPVQNEKLQDSAVTSITSVIRAFLTNDQAILEPLLKLGFNIRGSIGELERFVEQFVYNFDNVNKLGEGKSLHDYLNTKTDLKEARINIGNYGIQFGQSLGTNHYGFRYDNKGDIVSVQVGKKFIPKTDSTFNTKFEEAFKSLESQLKMMYSKISTDKIGDIKPIIGIENNKPIELYNNYNDYIKDNTKTNLQDFEYTNPVTGQTKFINTIQGKISIDTSFINKKEDVKEESIKDNSIPEVKQEHITTNPLGIKVDINSIDLGDEMYAPTISTIRNYLPTGESLINIDTIIDTATKIDIQHTSTGYKGDFLNDYTYLAEGSEHTVYINKDNTKVIKIGEPYNSSSTFKPRVTDAFNINTILGDKSLTLIGYYTSENGTKNPIYEQNYIEGNTLTQQEIETYLQSKGFNITDKGRWGINYNNKSYTFYDFTDNFKKDKEGNIIAIDADIIEEKEYNNTFNNLIRTHSSIVDEAKDIQLRCK